MAIAFTIRLGRWNRRYATFGGLSNFCSPNQRPKDLQLLECKGCRSLTLTSEKRENFSFLRRTL